MEFFANEKLQCFKWFLYFSISQELQMGVYPRYESCPMNLPQVGIKATLCPPWPRSHRVGIGDQKLHVSCVRIPMFLFFSLSNESRALCNLLYNERLGDGRGRGCGRGIPSFSPVFPTIMER
jgi:hypothetical protein